MKKVGSRQLAVGREGTGGHRLCKRLLFCLLLTANCLLPTGCKRDDMADQPRYEPLEKSTFFKDDSSARPLPAGTVARGYRRTDDAFFKGEIDGKAVTAIPMKITQADLERGRGRFNIYCVVCHGYDGAGNGMVEQRGFPHPPSYHIRRLRQASVGHIYQVITNGYGAMFSYADRIQPADRWRIAAYVKTLQLSRDALASLPPPHTRGGGSGRGFSVTQGGTPGKEANTAKEAP